MRLEIIHYWVAPPTQIDTFWDTVWDGYNFLGDWEGVFMAPKWFGDRRRETGTVSFDMNGCLS